jgi:hypothetical protein
MADNIRTGFGIHTAFSIPELSALAFAAAASKAPHRILPLASFSLSQFATFD